MNSLERNFILGIFLPILILFGVSLHYTGVLDKQAKTKDTNQKQQKEEIQKTETPQSEKENPKLPVEETSLPESHIKIIPVRRATLLSNKTKEEILFKRTRFVQKSIFRDENYIPSEEVFGQIEDNKPWVSTKICKYESNNQSDIEGPAEEARYINNPEVLVALEYGFYGHTCENRDPQFVKSQFPIKIEYDEEKKEMTNEYTYLPFCDSEGKVWYGFKGLNARDLGYKFAYLDLKKSTFKPHFKEKENISNSIIEFQDFIHVGGSCGVPGGCNNASPEQPPLNFIYPCTGEEGIRAKNRTLYIKLWKERPETPEMEADITQKIIIKSIKVPPGE